MPGDFKFLSFDIEISIIGGIIMKINLSGIMVSLSEKFKIGNFIIIGISVILLLMLTVGQSLYGKIDQKIFPEPATLHITDQMSENDRGIELLNAIVHQVKFELDSTFGWTANDIIFSPYILDNRAYRQFGVYNSTRVLIDVYSRVIAKLGNNDREDKNLYRAKSSYFTLSPARWGIFGISESAESSYKKGLRELETYKNNLRLGKATYNCKTDDIHTALITITGDQMLGYALGLLENSEDLPWYTLDNRIYEAQGMAIVIRDFLNAIYQLYPQISQKNNETNFQQAMYYLDKICEYDPIWISNMPFNNGAVVRSFLLNVKNRMEDVANSLRI